MATNRGDDYHKRIEDWNRRFNAHQEELAKQKPYDPSDMDCEKMPFGCWIVIGVAVFALLALAGVIHLH